MATLLTPDGKTIECHEPKPGHFFAASTWTQAEAAHYVETGEYPQRLLDVIKAQQRETQ